MRQRKTPLKLCAKSRKMALVRLSFSNPIIETILLVDILN